MTDDGTDPAERLANALDVLARVPPGGDRQAVRRRSEAAETVLFVAETAPDVVLKRSDEVAEVVRTAMTATDSGATAWKSDENRGGDVVETRLDLAAAVCAVAEERPAASGTLPVVRAALTARNSRYLLLALEAVDHLLGIEATGNADGRRETNPTVDADGGASVAGALAPLLTRQDGEVLTEAGERMAAVADAFPGVVADYVEQLGTAVNPTVGSTGDGNSVLVLQDVADERPSAVADVLDDVAAFVEASAHSGSFASTNAQQGLFVFQKVAEADPEAVVPYVDVVAGAIERYDTFRVYLHGLGTLREVARVRPAALTDHFGVLTAVVEAADEPVHAASALTLVNAAVSVDPRIATGHVDRVLDVAGRFGPSDGDGAGSDEVYHAETVLDIDLELALFVGDVSQTDPGVLVAHTDAIGDLVERGVTRYDPGDQRTVTVVANGIAALAEVGDHDVGALQERLDLVERGADAVDHENVTVNLLGAYNTVAKAQPQAVTGRLDRLASALERTNHDRGLQSGMAALFRTAAAEPRAVADHADTVAPILDRLENPDSVVAGIGTLGYVADEAPGALSPHVGTLLDAGLGARESHVTGRALEAVEAVAEADPSAVAENVETLLTAAESFEDLTLVELALMTVRYVARSKPAAVGPHVETVVGLFDRFEDQHIRSQLCTIVGFAAADRPDAAVDALDRILAAVDTFEDPAPLVNGLAAVGQVAEHRPDAVLDSLPTVVERTPRGNPVALANLAETLRYVSETDPGAAGDSLDVVVPALASGDERVQREVLATCRALAESRPDAVTPHVGAIADCLGGTRDPAVAESAVRALRTVATARATPLLGHEDAVVAPLDRFDDPPVLAETLLTVQTIEEGSVSGWIEGHVPSILGVVHRVEDDRVRAAGLTVLERPARSGEETLLDRARVVGGIVSDATDPDVLVAGTRVLYELASRDLGTVESYATDVGAAIRATDAPGETLWDALAVCLPCDTDGGQFVVGVLAGFTGLADPSRAPDTLDPTSRFAVVRILTFLLDGTESPETAGSAMDLLGVVGTRIPESFEPDRADESSAVGG